MGQLARDETYIYVYAKCQWCFFTEHMQRVTAVPLSHIGNYGSALYAIEIIIAFLFQWRCPGSVFDFYPGRKLLSVLKQIHGNVSLLECALECVKLTGCYAVNVHHGNGKACELTSGLSSDADMVVDVLYNVYVMGTSLQ